MASKKKATKAPAEQKAEPSKKDFVLGFPSDTPAAKVVEEAKAKGIKLSTAYVYVLRSKAGKKSGAAAPKGKPGRKAKAAGGSTLSPVLLAAAKARVAQLEAELAELRAEIKNAGG